MAMTAEEEVMASWKGICVDLDETDYTIVIAADLSPNEGSFIDLGTGTPEAAWQAALDFTRERKRQIAEVKEEIRWIQSVCCVFPNPDSEAGRILAKEQAALDALKRGMKEPA